MPMAKRPLPQHNLEVQRIVVAEQRTPLAAQLLRLKDHDVRTGGKANVQIFFLRILMRDIFPFIQRILVQ